MSPLEQDYRTHLKRRSGLIGVITRYTNNLNALGDYQGTCLLVEIETNLNKLIDSKANYDKQHNVTLEFARQIGATTETLRRTDDQVNHSYHDALMYWSDVREQLLGSSTSEYHDDSGSATANIVPDRPLGTADVDLRCHDSEGSTVSSNVGVRAEPERGPASGLNELALNTSDLQDRTKVEATILALTSHLSHLSAEQRQASTPEKYPGRRVTFGLPGNFMASTEAPGAQLRSHTSVNEQLNHMFGRYPYQRGDMSQHTYVRTSPRQARTHIDPRFNRLSREIGDGYYTRLTPDTRSEPPTFNLSSGQPREKSNSIFSSVPDASFQALLEQSHLQHKSLVESMKAPSATLPRFDGEPMNYTSFIGAFEDLVESTTDNPRAKLSTLIAHCDGKARDAIVGCAHMRADLGYLKARKTLASKFGDPYYISQAWLNKLLKHPPLRSPDSLEQFSLDLTSCRDSLEALGYSAELNSINTLRLIVAKLPIYLRNKWRKAHLELRQVAGTSPVDMLVDMVQEAAMIACDPVFGEGTISQVRNTYDTSGPIGSRLNKSPSRTIKRQSAYTTTQGFPEDNGLEFLSDQEQTFATTKSRSTCSICSSASHFTSRCRQYKAMKGEERKKLVEEKGLCILCLANNHQVKDCPLPWKCQDPTCGDRHHTSLHGALVPPATVCATDVYDDLLNASQPGEAGNDSTGEEVHCIQDNGSYLTATGPVLPLTPVELRNGNRTLETYALLDNASTVTLCHSRVMDKLELPSQGTTKLRINTIHGEDSSTGHYVNFEARSLGKGEFLPVFEAVTMGHLPISMDHVAAAGKLVEWKHLADLKFPIANTESVDLLVGQDNAHLLKPGTTVEAGKYDPYAVLTPLGWTIYGRIKKGRKRAVTVDQTHLITHTCMSTTNEEPDISTFWEAEQVPEVKPMKREDKEVLERWNREYKVRKGHIEIPIPFKYEPPNLPNNYIQALRALQSLGRHLLKHLDELMQYQVAMNKYFDHGHAIVVGPGVKVNLAYLWFLIHHGIQHPNKPGVTRIVKHGTTKFRGISLADVVWSGPDLMNSLTSVLTKFRRFKVGTGSDIENMFNQVLVPEYQQDCMSFLYWKDGDPNKEVIVCRMTTHIFGNNWSPSAAMFALRKTAELALGSTTEKAVQSVLEEFYVDDWLNSDGSPDAAAKNARDVTKVVEHGSFNLTKFQSTSRELIKGIPRERRMKQIAKLNLDSDTLPQGATLGVGLDFEKDEFMFTVKQVAVPPTRRGIMSSVASLFDPIGLLAPYIFPAKLVVREACKVSGSWDEVLPEEVMKPWSRWLRDLEEVAKIRFPRWIGCTIGGRQVLFHFGDGSERGYGTASYLCVLDGDDQVLDSNLVLGKSKLAPQRTLRIPRMEMSAAVMTIKADKAVKKWLGLELGESQYFTDSTLVLWYIEGDPANYRPFMANRASYIQSYTTRKQWHHVPGKLNPADLVSRGTTAGELLGNTFWAKGPEFIRQPRDEWPQDITESFQRKNTIQAESAELKKPKPVYLTTDGKVLPVDCQGCELPPDYEKRKLDPPLRVTQTTKGSVEDSAERSTEKKKYVVPRTPLSSSSLQELLTRYSTRKATVRAVAWLRRYCTFIAHGRESRNSTKLTVDELDRANAKLCKLNQTYHIKPGQLQNKSFNQEFAKDEDDTWRLVGRMAKMREHEDVKHPFLVPQNSPLATLIIREAHEAAYHAGADRTLTEMRRTYWLTAARQQVRKYKKNCTVCRRWEAKPQCPRMADLPTERLDPFTPPFSHTGVDLFGPFMIAVKRSSVKRYGAIFTCLSSRAVHLEPVADLSTSAFLNCLQRFTDRRGKPHTLYSDNGKNFVGSKKEVGEVKVVLASDKVHERLTEKGIRWVMNTPAASHQGGCWERLIRSTRKILLYVIGNQKLTDDMFYTALSMAESSINSRPLTRVDDSTESMRPLTPSQLLTQKPPSQLFKTDYSGARYRKDWRTVQALSTQFWNRWVALYLPSLQRRHRWREDVPNLKVGELVLILNDNVPRGQWPLGLVTEVYPGTDGTVRNAMIRTQNGSYRRPTSKIVRLEADT